MALNQLSKNSFIVMIKSILTLLLSFVVFLSDVPISENLILIFGIYFILDGILSIAGFLRLAKGSIMIGVFDIMVGIFILVFPRITPSTLIYLISAWALMSGIFSFRSILFMERLSLEWWSEILAGILSLVLAYFLIAFSDLGFTAFIGILGMYFLFNGTMNLFVASRMDPVAAWLT